MQGSILVQQKSGRIYRLAVFQYFIVEMRPHQRSAVVDDAEHREPRHPLAGFDLDGFQMCVPGLPAIAVIQQHISAVLTGAAKVMAQFLDHSVRCGVYGCALQRGEIDPLMVFELVDGRIHGPAERLTDPSSPQRMHGWGLPEPLQISEPDFRRLSALNLAASRRRSSSSILLFPSRRFSDLPARRRVTESQVRQTAGKAGDRLLRRGSAVHWRLEGAVLLFDMLNDALDAFMYACACR